MTREELDQTILTYNDYLDKMTGVIGHICDDIRETELEAVQTVLPAIIDGVAWIYDAAEGLVGMGLLEERKFQCLQSTIHELGETFEKQDLTRMYSLFSQTLFPALIDLKITAASEA
ncbi:hypothetical protein EDC14_1008135 [Hydrogenispora ethanolica]|uniref:DUF8042 domain-containing protein n=1 Tax=Hydrogenispora ethanolica TaxID=1082276 RepID=A0A4R1RWC3_HYDET|nr:hypothetical protein [Hydrogenispora ethanolica]TCL70985.1 hypothetical protein EDC14_1008135 [Hydrogenispora ethanolica]